ncbi:hypothetical protein IscW_ISCW014895 [Ixodes scapularis]|uniref:Uncharacterized protein n=1 Tax=Ixodes scapularis TaxID=6945 RepID=B7QK20_IXOSC|nr:hypothetical protein IscW_ISCW014895 [Ixodes scapularis]|eukprot:XP_002415527.1 hypothetical protein IscW_ISCW014895 [Ixodes scapularis]
MCPSCPLTAGFPFPVFNPGVRREGERGRERKGSAGDADVTEALHAGSSETSRERVVTQFCRHFHREVGTIDQT